MRRLDQHPFAGGRQTRGITQRHIPLIWENMLGTVMALDPATLKEKYFDYDWAGARTYARLGECSDLRVTRAKRGYQEGLQAGRMALFGIYERKAV